jgi:sugar-specific transcriptional regulator TrmB
MGKLSTELAHLGLKPHEVDVYLAALQLGETQMSRLVKKSGVKRSTAYLAVETLKEKHLLSSLKKKGRIFYTAEDPRLLQESEKERAEKISELMPQLLAITNAIDKKPSIRFYEGKEGVKEVFRDILKYPDSEVLEMYSESYITEFDEEFFSQYFTPRRIKNNIRVRAILPDNDAIQKYVVSKNVSELRQTKLLDKEKFGMRMEMNIYGRNKVSIISFKEEFGIIIESQIIRDSMKTVFELLWGNE